MRAANQTPESLPSPARPSLCAAPGSAWYRCNLCKKIVARKSEKRWIPTVCTKHGDVMARLYRLPNTELTDRRGAGSVK